MYDSGVLADKVLVRETDAEHRTRTISIARGKAMQYHVQVRDVVIKHDVVTTNAVEPERGHFERWKDAEAYLKQQVLRFGAEGFIAGPTKKELLRAWTLYRDSPQRHYRQIAARSENNAFFVVAFEGTVLSVDPFEKAPCSRDRFDCDSAEQALTKAQEIYDLSTADGWVDYHPMNG